MSTLRSRRSPLTALACLLLAGTAATTAHAQSATAFTYQGVLEQNGQPVNGTFDLQFQLRSTASGSQVGPAPDLCVFDVPVVDGVFTVSLDFGSAYASGQRWLEIRVVPNAANNCSTVGQAAPLAPRQLLSAAPVANFAQSTRGLSVNNANTRNFVIDSFGNFAARTGTDTIPLTISQDNNANFISFRSNANTERFRIRLGNSGELNFGGFDGSNVQDRVRMGATEGTALTVSGTTTTRVLTINGGADIAEPFNIHSDDSTPVQPGMVVSIDPSRTGELRVATKPYDSTVAGIISGANGVNVGLTLRQEGSIADGKHPVALTGRVWVLADATNAPIVAGDMLTSSSTPGHAMKVQDRDAAGGATIGKAMSSLESGQGYVLVLVNLQ